MVQVVGSRPTVDVKNGATCQLISHREVDLYWPKILEMLRCVPQTWNRHTEESLYAAASTGAMQIWGAGIGPIQLIVFSQIAMWPAFRTLQAFWAGGTEIEKLLPSVLASLEQFSQQNCCIGVEVIGRDGWEKLLKPYGYEKSAVVVQKINPTERLN